MKNIDVGNMLPKINVVEAPKFAKNAKAEFAKNLAEMKTEAYALLAVREDAEELFIE